MVVVVIAEATSTFPVVIYLAAVAAVGAAVVAAAAVALVVVAVVVVAIAVTMQEVELVMTNNYLPHYRPVLCTLEMVQYRV